MIAASTLDLWVATVVVLIISTVLFWVTARGLRGASLRRKHIFTATVVATIVMFGLFLYDSCFLLTLLPLQSVVLYGNLSLPLSAMLAAALWKVQRIPVWRRVALMMLCICFGAYLSFACVVSEPPDCANLWNGNVCLQSSYLTCSPAAAVTLLKQHGIESTEEEMAGLCLTNKRGTPLHGLYRGFRIKTKHTAYRVKTGSVSLAQLRNSLSMPVILNVKLSGRAANREPRYAEDWGWQVGIPHTVVLFGIDSDQRVDIGDPGVGREFWDLQALRDLWHGEYIALRARE